MADPKSNQPLEPRKQVILRAVVVEYVAAAEPVSSDLITQRYALGVKSATIRNELASMLELGFLEQPHTSSGRIPTDKGYRYFVDNMIESESPSPEDRQLLKKLANEGDTLQDLLRETAKMLSRRTQLLSLGLSFQNSSVTVRTVLVSALGPQQAMMVMVLNNGHVENRMVECPPLLTLDDIGMVNEQLKSVLEGFRVSNLAKVKLPDSENPALNKLYLTLQAVIRSIGRDLNAAKVVVEGEQFMFGQPEFQNRADEVHDILEAIHDPELVFDAVVGAGDDIQTVSIGRENRDGRLQKVSIVRKSFTIGTREAGVIALIGPTRMKYPSSLAMVDHGAMALSHALTKYFG